LSRSGGIPVVDFFAGPGGLGEGFSALEDRPGRHPFKVALSVEKDAAAHRTLTLRAFLRRFARNEVPASYYRYVLGKSSQPWDLASLPEWREAEREAMLGTLGEPESDSRVHTRLRELRLQERPWVLIGGPPCQAYSLVGRARNAGNTHYRPDRDERHFLYRRYLAVLDEYRPPVFVMENVKGILSSTVQGKRIFSRILADLSAPSRALGREGKSSARYRIRAVCEPVLLESGSDASEIDPNSFVVPSERHGVPQTRHRVILVGVPAGIRPKLGCVLAPEEARLLVSQAISDLPRLRSGLSHGADDSGRWAEVIRRAAGKLIPTVNRMGLDRVTNEVERIARREPESFPKLRRSGRPPAWRAREEISRFHEWCLDAGLGGTLNHETRLHMRDDLERYLFCASFSRAEGRSPRARDFPNRLAPDHASWENGDFADRFHVQGAREVASTITSHLAKDGHYFIHYDPVQCRSLTVREAARLQTFPDNYFFEGTRTQQYVQVGNAVPPLLATKLARIVHAILAG